MCSRVVATAAGTSPIHALAQTTTDSTKSSRPAGSSLVQMDRAHTQGNLMPVWYRDNGGAAASRSIRVAKGPRTRRQVYTVWQLNLCRLARTALAGYSSRRETARQRRGQQGAGGGRGAPPLHMLARAGPHCTDGPCTPLHMIPTPPIRLLAAVQHLLRVRSCACSLLLEALRVMTSVDRYPICGACGVLLGVPVCMRDGSRRYPGYPES